VATYKLVIKLRDEQLNEYPTLYCPTNAYNVKKVELL
jgi:hypothetical protein